MNPMVRTLPVHQVPQPALASATTNQVRLIHAAMLKTLWQPPSTLCFSSKQMRIDR